MPIGNYITDKIRQGGFSQLELACDPALKSFIEQISNEQKISWVQDFSNGDPEWEEWESTLYHGKETELLPRDMEDIVRQLFGDSSEFQMGVTHFSKINRESAIPGMSPKIKRNVGNDGVVYFYPQFAEFDYIFNNMLDPESLEYQSMIDNVMLPYIDFVEKTDVDKGGLLPFEVPENIRRGMAKVFEDAGTVSQTNDMNKDAMIDYTIYNILQLASSVEMRTVLNKIRNAMATNGRKYNKKRGCRRSFFNGNFQA